MCLTAREELASFLSLGTSSATKDRYKAGVSEWKAFLSLNEITDVYLRTWKQGEKEVLVASFLNHLSRDQKLSQSKLKSIWDGVKRDFVENFAEAGVFQAPTVIAARRAAHIQTIGGRTQGRALAEERPITLPISREFLTELRLKTMANPSATLDAKMTYVATALAAHIGNRPCEFSKTSRRGKRKATEANVNPLDVVVDHRYRARDIDFEVGKSGNYLKPWEVTRANYEALTYARVQVLTQKPDQLGERELRPNGVRCDGPEGELFWDLVEWCMISGIMEGDFFFSRWQWSKNLRRPQFLNRKLQSSDVSKALKETALSLNIDSKHFSCKSLRKYTKTQLDVQGVPNSTINAIGRWKDPSANRVYGHASSVTGALSLDNDKTLSVRDLRRMLPPSSGRPALQPNLPSNSLA